MKIAMHPAWKHGKPHKNLPQKSVNNLTNALIYASNTKKNMDVVVAMDGCFIGPGDGDLLVKGIEKEGAEVVSAKATSVVIKTPTNHVVTASISGGTAMFGRTRPMNGMRKRTRSSFEGGANASDGSNSDEEKLPPSSTLKRAKVAAEPEENDGSEEEEEECGSLTQECAGLF